MKLPRRQLLHLAAGDIALPALSAPFSVLAQPSPNLDNTTEDSPFHADHDKIDWNMAREVKSWQV
jgi:hypothetical protein